MKLRTTDRHLFVYPQTTIGDIYVFCVTSTILSALSRRLGSSLREAKSEDLVRFLFSQVAYRFHGEGTPEDRKQCEQIGSEEAEGLTSEDVEEFARRFLESSDNLAETEPKEGSATDRLSRVVVKSAQEHTETVARAAQQFKSLQENLFPKSIVAQMVDSVRASRRLSSSVAAIQNMIESGRDLPEFRQYCEPHPRISEVTIPDIPPNPIHDTNKRLDKLLESQAATLPILIDSANLLNGMSNLSRDLALDYKSSSKIATRYTIATTVIALITLASTLIYSVLSYRSSIESSSQVERLLRKLDQLNATVAASNRSAPAKAPVPSALSPEQPRPASVAPAGARRAGEGHPVGK